MGTSRLDYLYTVLARQPGLAQNLQLTIGYSSVQDGPFIAAAPKKCSDLAFLPSFVGVLTEADEAKFLLRLATYHGQVLHQIQLDLQTFLDQHYQINTNDDCYR